MRHDWVETHTDDRIRRYCFDCGRLEERLDDKWTESDEVVEIVKKR